MHLDFSLSWEFLCFAEEVGLEQGCSHFPQTGYPVYKKSLFFPTNIHVELAHGSKWLDPRLPSHKIIIIFQTN